MGYLQKLKQLEIEVKPKAQVGDITDNDYPGLVAGLSLAEFENRNLGVQIHSEILGCEVWFCSNDSMVEQIRSDDPQAVIYTANELEELLSKNSNPRQLSMIHSVKAVFKKSRILRKKKD